KSLEITKRHTPEMEEFYTTWIPMDGMNKRILSYAFYHARKIGAFDQIAVVEEPFEENNEVYVGDMGVIIGADESAHTVEDAAKRIEQGYGAIVLKGIAKTLSMTLKIAKLAAEKKVPCFCADLTV